MIELTVDIDDTLAQTNLFWARHHLEAYGSPEGLTAEAIIAKYRYIMHVPYWQSVEAKNWVEAHISSNEAKLEIPVIEESIEIMQRMPVSCYITTRPESTVDGTRRWLRKHGFPDKEVFATGSMEGKAKIIENIFPRVKGMIDDNIDLLEHLSPGYNGKIFLYSHSLLRR